MYYLQIDYRDLIFFSTFYQKSIDKQKKLCYNKDAKGQREREVGKNRPCNERYKRRFHSAPQNLRNGGPRQCTVLKIR